MVAKSKVAAKPTRPKPSLDELFGRMDKKNKEVPALPKIEKRPAMALTPELAAEFATLVGFHAVFDKVQTRFENQKLEVSSLAFDSWTEFVWLNKCRPTKNPSLETKTDVQTCKAIFQVQDRFKFDFPEIGKDQTAEDIVVSMLVDMGVKEPIAQEIVAKELDFTPKRGVRNLNEVVEHEGGEDAVRKFLIMCYSDAEKGSDTIEVEALTDEDRTLLFYNTASVKVADGFMDRLPHYVKDLNEFRAVLKVVRPVYFPSHMKLVTDNEFKALTDIAADMLGLADADSK